MYSCMIMLCMRSLILVFAQGVAEHGIIEYVEMHQFMCHKFLTFNFGPQINFIIGAFMPRSWNPCCEINSRQ
jgi:hypothetical protein